MKDCLQRCSTTILGLLKLRAVSRLTKAKKSQVALISVYDLESLRLWKGFSHPELMGLMIQSLGYPLNQEAWRNRYPSGYRTFEPSLGESYNPKSHCSSSSEAEPNLVELQVVAWSHSSSFAWEPLGEWRDKNPFHMGQENNSLLGIRHMISFKNILQNFIQFKQCAKKLCLVDCWHSGNHFT